MIHKNHSIFIDKIDFVVKNRELIKLTINNRRNKSSDLKTIIISIVNLKAGEKLNFVYRHETKDITKNYNFEEGIEIISKALENDFFNAELFSNSANIQFIATPNGKVHLKTSAPTLHPIATFAHDKVKERLINPLNNIYLRELGITNAAWEVRREMSDKYIQINRYIELLAPNLNDLSITNNYHIVDMGSGKGYLTFALYDYFTSKLKKTVTMKGIEYRAELVATCNSIAQKAHFENLTFVQGSIEKTQLEQIDILIALHACDTATDDAIFRGIEANAALIICAPCCHKQIRRDLNVTNELSEIVKFGILKERQAEILTDTIRALIMEAYGYKTSVFEFISSEHTPKNVMIVGRKTNIKKPERNDILNKITALKTLFGIEKHYLETLLQL